MRTDGKAFRSGLGRETARQSTDLPGEVVKLTAKPEIGWCFLDWSGAFTGNTNPACVTMNNDKMVSANFAINQYVVVISRNPQNGGVVPGGGKLLSR
ncbi:hypothetical protein [Mesotoga sp.]|uniref:InlB B-repeat-containing protein n=1 Tax=Mesotoga sp. TaxID=2053577 RepID=UPI00345EFCEB